MNLHFPILLFQLGESPGIDVLENFGKNIPKHLTIGETILQEHHSHYHVNTTLEISRYYRAFVRAYTGKYVSVFLYYSKTIFILIIVNGRLTYSA